MKKHRSPTFDLTAIRHRLNAAWNRLTGSPTLLPGTGPEPVRLILKPADSSHQAEFRKHLGSRPIRHSRRFISQRQRRVNSVRLAGCGYVLAVIIRGGMRIWTSAGRGNEYGRHS